MTGGDRGDVVIAFNRGVGADAVHPACEEGGVLLHLGRARIPARERRLPGAERGEGHGVKLPIRDAERGEFGTVRR